MREHIKQEEILRLMAEGWEMGHSTTIDAYTWLQKGKVGHGGEHRNVHSSTFAALRRRDLIQSTGYRFPTETYVLTETPMQGDEHE